MTDVRVGQWIVAAVLGSGLTLVLTALLVRFAPALGLLDIPNERKRHKGAVPVVGGLAIGLSYLAVQPLLPPPCALPRMIVLAICTLLLVGVVDDRCGLTARVRLCAQAVAAVFMIADGTFVSTLGDLLGRGHLNLSPGVGFAFTLFCVMGVINGFNMLDGLDGLASGVGVVILGTFTAVGVASGGIAFPGRLGVFLGCLLGFLLLHNMPATWRRRLVFLGDGGSMMLGFIMAWSGISLVDRANDAIYPISVVWIMGTVVLDTVTTVLRRVVSGKNPVAGGRDHLHHLLLELGVRPTQVLILIVGATVVMAAIGIAGEELGVSESRLAALFAGTEICYYAIVTLAWRKVAQVGRGVRDLVAGNPQGRDSVPSVNRDRRVA